MAQFNSNRQFKITMKSQYNNTKCLFLLTASTYKNSCLYSYALHIVDFGLIPSKLHPLELLLGLLSLSFPSIPGQHHELYINNFKTRKKDHKKLASYTPFGAVSEACGL